jgi:hypothetical protein
MTVLLALALLTLIAVLGYRAPVPTGIVVVALGLALHPMATAATFAVSALALTAGSALVIRRSLRESGGRITLVTATRWPPRGRRDP